MCRRRQGIYEDLEMCLDQLQRCQKALSDFLDEKRSLMPRFYFIGDDDLLEILGQAQNAEARHCHRRGRAANPRPRGAVCMHV